LNFFKKYNILKTISRGLSDKQMWYYTKGIPVKRMAKKVNCDPRHVRRLCQKYGNDLLAYKGKNGRWGIRPTSLFIIKAILNPERYVMILGRIKYPLVLSIRLAELKDGKPVPVLRLNDKRVRFLYQHKVEVYWYSEGTLITDKMNLKVNLSWKET